MYKKHIIERIINEQDKDFYHPYPLEKITACLEVVENELGNLEATILYLENLLRKRHLYIYGWETASTIDLICSEYGIRMNAETSYQIQETNEKSSSAFPFGDFGGFKVDSEEFGYRLGYDDYFERLANKYKPRKNLGKEKIKETITCMNALKKNLREGREAALNYIVRQGCWSDEYVLITAEVDTETGTYWEVITLPCTGQSFRRVSSKERMERVITDKKCHQLISINRRKEKKGVFCGSHIDYTTVYQALRVIREVAGMLEEHSEYTVEKDVWVKECQNNALLQQFIKRI